MEKSFREAPARLHTACVRQHRDGLKKPQHVRAAKAEKRQTLRGTFSPWSRAGNHAVPQCAVHAQDFLAMEPRRQACSPTMRRATYVNMQYIHHACGPHVCVCAEHVRTHMRSDGGQSVSRTAMTRTAATAAEQSDGRRENHALCVCV